MTDLSDLAPVSGLRGEAAPGANGVSDPHDTGAVIRFERVGHRYRGMQGETDALVDIDFAIRRGEVFGIIGRSGAGKSTLLRTINLLEKPSSGRVLVHGEDMSLLHEGALARARRRIGMIFQHFNLLSSATVAQNIGLPLKIAGAPAVRIAEKVDSLLRLVGLEDKRDAYPARLSGGQKQRVGIARALVHDPDILLCDEATSALDPETTESILLLLSDINRKLGLSIVMVTHEMEVIRQACDRVAVLERGRLAELGEVWQVFGAPHAEATRALLRTVIHDLPRDIAQRIAPQRRDASDALLLEARIDGSHAQDIDLAALVASLGESEVRLVHGAVERLQGRSQGRLILAVPGDSVFPPQSLAHKPGWTRHSLRPIGYLRGEGAAHA